MNYDKLKLLDWISQDKLRWSWLSSNPSAIHLLEQNPDKIYWPFLSQNPNAISLLEQNPDKIYWPNLSANPNAIHLLERNLDKIDWWYLSQIQTPFLSLNKIEIKLYGLVYLKIQMLFIC
jgi:hypothetical protein